MSVKQIDPQQTHNILQQDKNSVYLDVRTAEEFANGHVPGAINIPAMCRTRCRDEWLRTRVLWKPWKPAIRKRRRSSAAARWVAGLNTQPTSWCRQDSSMCPI